MLQVSISNAEKISSDLYRAKLIPSQVRFFGNANKSIGETSIIYIEENTYQYDAKNKVISFDPQTINLINVGNSEDVLILTKTSNSNKNSIPSSNQPKLINPGDVKFIGSLPTDLKTLGKNFISEVRKHFNGDLKPSDSGKFIESPDNFWTVKIQPRDKSLRITVRGIPSHFRGIQKIILKDDMAGYSSFKLINVSEIEEAIKIINQANKK